jgi:uncharacterized protein (DUF1778 family)
MPSKRSKLPDSPADAKRLVVAPATEGEILRIDRAAVELRTSRAKFLIHAALQVADQVLAKPGEAA